MSMNCLSVIGSLILAWQHEMTGIDGCTTRKGDRFISPDTATLDLTP
jgi:hypothetical protein